MKDEKRENEAKRIHNEWRVRKGLDYLRGLNREASKGKGPTPGTPGKDTEAEHDESQDSR